jgi:mono/diheme cytochrome c family protein
MRSLFLAGLAVICLGAAPSSAQSLMGDAARGYEFAKARCVDCHMIEKGIVGRGRMNAPAFQSVANDPAATEMSLRVFLRSPHAKMPNLVLSEQESDDVVAYILSLK